MAFREKKSIFYSEIQYIKYYVRGTSYEKSCLFTFAKIPELSFSITLIFFIFFFINSYLKKKDLKNRSTFYQIFK